MSLVARSAVLALLASTALLACGAAPTPGEGEEGTGAAGEAWTLPGGGPVRPDGGLKLDPGSPPKACSTAATNTCSAFGGVTDPAWLTALVAHVPSAAACTAPGTFCSGYGTDSIYMNSVDYTVCPDTPELRAYVGAQPDTMPQGPAITAHTGACLSAPTAGKVYLIWPHGYVAVPPPVSPVPAPAPVLKASAAAVAPTSCHSGCMLPPNI